MEKTSAAQHLFWIVKDHGIDSDAIGLIRHLASANLISPSDVVIEDKYDKKAKSLKLSEAFLNLAKPDCYCAQMYQPETAVALIELDPGFFNRANPDGSSWLEQTLVGWSKSKEASRLGFKASESSETDEWLSVVLDSLPEDIRRSETLWDIVLKLNLGLSADKLVQYRSEGWGALLPNGRAEITNASEGWAWDRVLASGIDVHAKNKKGVPFWRTCLPAASVTEAARGSLRERVEEWLEEEKKEASPEWKQVIKNYKTTLLHARINHTSWRRCTLSEKMKLLSQLPATWVNEPSYGPLGWLCTVGLDVNWKSWIGSVLKNESWMREIKKDPVSILALAVLLTEQKVALPFEIKDLNVSKAKSDPRYTEVAARLKKVMKVDSDEIVSFLDACSISEKTPAAKASRRSGPRL